MQRNAHITDESKKEKKLKIPPKSGKSQHNNPFKSSHAGPITVNHRQHYLDKIGPGKSTITASNPRGLSITQSKIYNFIHDNFETEENNNVDHGNENMKTLKMGSFRDTLKRPRENNINSINDDFNNERTLTFSTPVRQNDETPNINVNIENLDPIEIGITP